jgi:hypothetical protein
MVVLSLCGAGLVVGGIFGALSLAKPHSENPTAQPWLVALCLGFAGLGVYLLLSLFRSRVVLFPERLEIEELTHVQVLSREELRGWRLLPTSPSTLVLIPRDPERNVVKVALIFRIDAELAEWLDTLPCLDTVDLEASETEILNEARLGSSPDERALALMKAHRLARMSNLVSIAATCWALAYPQPYQMAIAAQISMPWVGLEIMRRSRGLLRADEYPNDAHPSVAVLLLLPGAVLTLRAMLDYSFVGLRASLWCAIGIGSLLWWATRSIDPTVCRKVGTNVALAFFSIMYGFGSALEADALLDRSPEVEHAVHVEGKQVRTGKVTRYVLQVEPWAPNLSTPEVQVGRATYDHIQHGDVLHLVVRNGALGVPWFYMRSWELGRSGSR